MKFSQYQGDTAGLRKQAPALFLSVTTDETFQFPIARSRQFGPTRVHFLCAASICLPKRLATALVGFRRRSACGGDCSLFFERVSQPKTRTRTFLSCAPSDAVSCIRLHLVLITYFKFQWPMRRHNSNGMRIKSESSPFSCHH